MTSSGPLSILLAGKLPRSQAPIVKQIESSFPNVRVYPAHTEKEAGELLALHHSQVTLCDVSTFGITIEKVAALLQAQKLHSRILAVTEPESAPEIVQTISRGARDAISLKDPLHAMLVIARELEILPDWCARNAQLLDGRIGKEAVAHAVGDDIIWCNEVFAQVMARKAPGELAHQAFWACIDGDDHYRLKRAMQSCAAGQPPNSPVDARALAPDGRRIALSFRLSLKQVESGTVVHLAARESSTAAVPAAYGGQINVAVLKRLQAAMTANTLAIALQPITPLADSSPGEVNKLDVLARIKDAEGELAAAEFMREASAAGLLRQLDHWIIRSACVYYARNAGKGEALLFLRLSRQSLQDRNTLSVVKNALAQYQVKPQHLSFELAEAEFSGLQPEEAATLFSLKKMGCRLTLSQFGNGKNSLETMQNLPLDFIKLDVKLTEDAAKSDAARTKLKLIVGPASQRGIGTISTRVADATTLAELWKLGVNFVQGHYVHEPEIVVGEPAKR